MKFVQIRFDECQVIMQRTSEGLKHLKTGDDYHDKMDDWFQGFIEGLDFAGSLVEVETHFIPEEVDFFETYNLANYIYDIKDYNDFYTKVLEHKRLYEND